MHVFFRHGHRTRALTRLLAPTAMLTLALCGTAAAQTLSKEAAAPSGSTMSWGGGSLTMTVGETVVGRSSSGGTTLYSGFLPPPRTLVSASVAVTGDRTLRAFPQPATDNITVDLPALPSLSLELVDVFGRQHLVQRNVVGRTTVDLTGVPAGGYVLRVFSGLESVHTETIMVIR